jgi:hypothetical protein
MKMLPLACHRLRLRATGSASARLTCFFTTSSAYALPTRNNALLPQIPTAKIPLLKTPYFPRIKQKPLYSTYLKSSKNLSRRTEQKFDTHRKTPHQTTLLPPKCSTIHPQKFPRSPVIYGTSHPRLVQKFNPKMHNNSNKKIPLNPLLPNSSLGAPAPSLTPKLQYPSLPNSNYLPRSQTPISLAPKLQFGSTCAAMITEPLSNC